MEKFNIYTAIAYTSGKPHIGNTYEIVLADAIARYKRMKGFDVYFQTGTDEHGQKIEEKAASANMSPQEFTDNVAGEIKNIWDLMNTSYDNFVRTTDKMHEKKVQDIFTRLYEKGDIYKGEYEGLYCKSCEAFYTTTQVEDDKCPECGMDVYKTKEEAYFLNMKKYEKRLKKHIEDNPSFIYPESRKNEMMKNFIEKGLDDLCVSRTSFSWGIQVSFDPKHVVYVWLDALTNYITFSGYDSKTNSFENVNYWPADLHIIGKDILRFHLIYWPIILMALDIELPKTIFAHPWVLSGIDKMSKSKGNIIYPDDIVNKYGVDALRYYFLSQISYANDGLYTEEMFVNKYNADLANNLGNLVNRTISMTKKYYSKIVPTPTLFEEVDNRFLEEIKSLEEEFEKKIEEYKVAEAVGSLMNIFDKANKYIDVTQPWILGKEENNEKLKTVMYNLLEVIRHGAVLLSAVIPDTSKNILDQLNTNARSYESLKNFQGLEYNSELNDPEPLFKRIDIVK